MQKSLKTFFVFSLLLIFVSNVCGINVCLEHSKHATSKSVDTKHGTEKDIPTISQDDGCQCALHLQMNASLLPQVLAMDFSLYDSINVEVPHSKVSTYRCLLDYFSSRAPPVSFTTAV